MTTLTEFLQARLAEKEQAAREAADHDSGRWFMGDKWNIYRAESEVDEVDGTVTHDLVAWGNAKPQSEHIARHDPARVLADVEAKRRIIEQYERALENRQAHPDDLASAGALLALHGVVGSLTMPYAHHPDYDPGWKP